jgi:hypothetical protein
MHPALRASHHFFLVYCPLRRIVAINFSAVALENPICKQQAQDEQNDFCHALRLINTPAVSLPQAPASVELKVSAPSLQSTGEFSWLCLPGFRINGKRL